MAHGGSFPCYRVSGLPSRSKVGSYGACPFHHHGGQYGGPSLHPWDVSPFIFQHHGVLVAPEPVLHAAALVASSLGDTVVLLSSLQHTDAPPPSASDMTMSFSGFAGSHQGFDQPLVPGAVPVPFCFMGGSLALFLHSMGGSLLPLLLLLHFHKVLLLFHWLLQWSL